VLDIPNRDTRKMVTITPMREFKGIMEGRTWGGSWCGSGWTTASNRRDGAMVPVRGDESRRRVPQVGLLAAVTL
jgi:hypothetical protein